MVPDKRCKYTPDRCKQVYRLALLGHTEKVIAGAMLISPETLAKWKNVYPEFDEALNEGRIEADSHVVASLYKKACGYEYYEEKGFMYKGEVIKEKLLKHVPPDSWAAMKWLGLRQRSHWADVQKMEVTNNQNISISAIDLTQYSIEELQIMKKIGLTQKSLNEGVIGEN